MYNSTIDVKDTGIINVSYSERTPIAVMTDWFKAFVLSELRAVNAFHIAEISENSKKLSSSNQTVV